MAQASEDPRAESPPTAAGANTVCWVGHATAAITIDGVRVLTDPLLVPQMVPFVRRRAPGEVALDVVAAPDVVVISHAHQDHLHLPSLRMLPYDTRILVPPGVGRWLERSGFRNVEEIGAGDAVWVGGVRVHATPAAHDGRRPPLGPNAPALGYLIEGSGAVYFAGDTDLFEGMADLPHVLDGVLDLALLPVGGWGPTLGSGHMDPRRAAAALRLLRPAEAIPVHWGTFWPRGLGRVRPHRFHLPGTDFDELAREAAPHVRVQVLQPGDSWSLGSV